MSPLSLVRDPAQISILFDPDRLRVPSELTEPDSASGVARRLSLPRQQVNYYVRDLEKTGLVSFVEERGRTDGRCLRGWPENTIPANQPAGRSDSCWLPTRL